uniref:Kazal-like domain-containing protein n=1 Tax=Esox lucius TaxID=8010 RepID=A0A6Q2X1R8_ESOLU
EEASTCPSLSVSLQCGVEYAPVCGSNSHTYQNECFLRQDACKLQTEILASSQDPCPAGTADVDSLPLYYEYKSTS